MNRFRPIYRAALITAAVALSLSSAPKKNNYTKHDKAYFANDATVQFVRPGLNITVNSAKIASDGTITVIYSVADPGGLPLDTAGITTPGTISLSFVAATIPATQSQYVTYTTRSATGTVLGTITQPGADSGGTTTPVAPGQYQYVFKTKAPNGYDQAATHTIGIYGSRSLLTLYGLPNNFASTTFNFVPNGNKVTKVRDVIKSASCNACHDQISFHGGSRRGIEMCVLCHTPQNLDPGTGQSMDTKVLFHKLHMGENLPSVKAGTPYIAVISSRGTTDYSDVAFPADPGDPRRCEVCHSQTTKAAQATAYMTNPTRVACGSCHDDVNFASGKNHPGGPQFDDNLCANCHIPQGEMDFDASIKGAHVAPTASSLLSGVNVNITKITGGLAGTAPTVAFTLKDNNGNGIPLSTMSSAAGGSLSFTMTGPTGDYGTTNFGSDVTTLGYVTETANAKSTCDPNGNCTYTFTHVVPAKMTGTFAIGVEGRRTETVLPNTTIQQSIRYGIPNKVAYFSVDGSTVTPRRTVVAQSQCLDCHVSLQLHGGLRNNVEYCVFCHNPSMTDYPTRPSATNPADKAAPNQGINFNLMVHRIHWGTNMAKDNRTYVVVGFGGSHNDFSNTLFPAMGPNGSPLDLQNCSMCHVNGSELNLPNGKLPVADPQGPISPNQPVQSACSGCHTDIPAAVHGLTNSTQLGEACSVCHSSGAAFAVDKVHAQY